MIISITKYAFFFIPEFIESRTPIIVIPSGPNNIITMYNAKDILQDLRYFFLIPEYRPATLFRIM